MFSFGIMLGAALVLTGVSVVLSSALPQDQDMSQAPMPVSINKARRLIIKLVNLTLPLVANRWVLESF